MSNYFLNTIRSTLEDKLLEYKKGSYKPLPFHLHNKRWMVLRPSLDDRNNDHLDKHLRHTKGKHLLLRGSQEIAILTLLHPKHTNDAHRVSDVGKPLSFCSIEIQTDEGIKLLARFLTDEGRESYYY